MGYANPAYTCIHCGQMLVFFSDDRPDQTYGEDLHPECKHEGSFEPVKKDA